MALARSNDMSAINRSSVRPMSDSPLKVSQQHTNVVIGSPSHADSSFVNHSMPPPPVGAGVVMHPDTIIMSNDQSRVTS